MQPYADYSNRLDPNCFTSDRGGRPVLVLVCHNTEGAGEYNTGQTAAEAQQHSDFEASYLASNAAQVSIHWVVGEEECGAPIYKVVPEQYTAYHCGGEPGFPSQWKDPHTGNTYGGYGLNEVAIGIELVGQHNESVGPNQLASLKNLVLDIVARYPILKEPGRIVAHAWLEGDRQDGRNWVAQAQSWVAEFAANSNNNAQITPVPPSNPNQIPGVDGKMYWVVGAIRDFYDKNGWLGLPLGPELGAKDNGGFAWDGSYQYFERGRVENHSGAGGIMLGRVGAELVAAFAEAKPK